MSDKIVRIENLSHKYSKDWAIKDINFEIGNNEILGLLGSNGAGKSTTMNILCGVLNQTEGNVYINGINMRKNPIEAKKYIGFLPQKPPVYPDLTVREYLTHCAYLRLGPKCKIAKAVDEALEKCGLTSMSKRVIRNLSGGYQQRVGIAQSIIHKPKLVVFDEPTTGLDPNNIVEIRALISEIAEDRAVVLCSHILPEVQATCGTIKMIEKGKLVFSDTMEAFNDYIEPNTISLALENPPSKEDILSINGVKEVRNLNGNKFQIVFDTSINVSRAIVNKCIEKDWGLLEIVLEKQSLDLIFAHLSGKNSK
ncbi:ABC transporter ATP-binding protein [Marinifilum sp.]|uniref:ABC transporter ATP-binding protein n=1 Tax=Marinifilum sp. TaxID=2033137 RepID=UPI003BAA5272